MIIKGSIDEIIFRNDENGYTVLNLDVDGSPVICVGAFPPITEGEFLSLEGEFIMHPKFGKQFKTTKAITKSPEGEDAIIRYLGSGIIKGVGPKTALAIVSKFKEKTLEIIEFTPHKLAQVKGISRDKADNIGKNYNKIKAVKEAVMFLQKNGITLNMSLKIYNVFKDDTISVVSSNPYILVEHVERIGFASADRIAQKMGIEKDSKYRIRAGIMHVLNSSGERNGNTCLPFDELIEEASRLLGQQTELIKEEIENLIINSKLKRVLIEEREGCMLTSMYRTEYNCAVKLIDLLSSSNKIAISCNTEIKEFENENKIFMHELQKDAVITAATNGIVVITGGPGTGKTTIVKCILSVFDKLQYRTVLMAPTGRAAKRLSESTGKDASTIHRALMLGRDKSQGIEILEADCVIVDEVSMIDTYLLSQLLSRLRQGTRLILVGDKDQLPSVGAGNILADILTSGLIVTVNLSQVYRQSEESLIITNAHLINSGQMPKLDVTNGDFFFIKADSAQRICDKVLELMLERLPTYLNVPPSAIQVLSPMKNGLAGTINLNAKISTALRSSGGASVQVGDDIFKQGDKVMHTVNNYDLAWRKNTGNYIEDGEGVFNGDLGYIYNIRVDMGEVDVLMEDARLVTYSRTELDQIILAYAITVHKSQGSEFEAVIIPVYGGNPVMMTRNLLYTAITRAKRMVVLVGEKYHIKKMLENNYVAKRYSMLKTFLLQAHKKNALLFSDNNPDESNVH